MTNSVPWPAPWRSWAIAGLYRSFANASAGSMVSSRLGIARHLPAVRLKKFVRFGELRRDRRRESPARYGYVPTRRGLDLHPIVMAFVNWSDRHMVDERG